MGTVAIVLIAIGIIILLAFLWAANRRRQAAQLEERRQVASVHREEADSQRITADKEAAAADEQAAAARRQAAEAEERARVAQDTRATATAHAEHAEQIDPDADDREGEPAPATTNEGDPRA